MERSCLARNVAAVNEISGLVNVRARQTVSVGVFDNRH